jgi:hypothetical protein
MFVAAAFVIGAAVTTAGVIHAATTNSTANPMGNLVNAIATKFNLNVSDVQAVFDAQRSEMEAQHTQAATDRIKQAVTDGKLTQEQSDKIIAKQAEMKTFMESLKDKSETDRRQAMKSNMDSLKQWATDNNIPAEYLMFVGSHGGPGMGFMHFEKERPERAGWTLLK